MYKKGMCEEELTDLFNISKQKVQAPISSGSAAHTLNESGESPVEVPGDQEGSGGVWSLCPCRFVPPLYALFRPWFLRMSVVLVALLQCNQLVWG